MLNMIHQRQATLSSIAALFCGFLTHTNPVCEPGDTLIKTITFVSPEPFALHVILFV